MSAFDAGTITAVLKFPDPTKEPLTVALRGPVRWGDKIRLASDAEEYEVDFADGAIEVALGAEMDPPLGAPDAKFQEVQVTLTLIAVA